MKNLLAILFLIPLLSFGQELETNGNEGGTFSLGFRTTLSTFNSSHDESNGLGAGAQFRLQFSDRVNSDWFFDYIRSDIGNFANRVDYHIGWSVLYYPTKEKEVKIRPYILAGHCFDYTLITANNDASNFDERWSSAVQGGLGTHFNLSSRMDLSLTAQYMIHLGNEAHVHQHEDGEIEFESEGGTTAEGHLLFNVSLNYKIGKLW